MNPAPHPGRNDPCPCGSGKRYKHCCGAMRGAMRGAMPGRPASADQLGALVSMVQRGHLREAEEAALAQLKAHPATGMIWKILSVALVRQGKNALPALRKAAELMPEDAEVHGNLGSALLAAGQSAEALASLRRALQLRPNDVEALVEAADATRALDHLDEAIALYQQALQLDPHLPHARNNLGNALLKLGRLDEAMQSYRLALESLPQDADVLANLADALRQHGELEESVRCSEQAIGLAPALARAHIVLGASLAGLGQREAAVVSLRRGLALDARSVEARTNLANVLRELGDRREALALCREALELDPRRAETHYSLGNVLFELRRLDQAVDSFRQAMTLRPADPLARLALAAALRIRGQAEEAEASCQAVLATAPSSVEALVLLGELRGDLGRFAEAEELLERAISLDARCAPAYCGIAAHRRMTGDDTRWLSGARALIEQPLPLQHRIALQYALGKYFDDVGGYDGAFRHYREANELTKRYGSRYDGTKLTARVDRIVRRFDATSFGERDSRIEPRPDLSPQPIFIIGMPRSGTSLAEQILASHPQVRGAGEVRFWDEAWVAFENTERGSEDAAARLAGFASDYLARLKASQPGASPSVVDKMPANFLYAGLIHAALPRARIIHMQRHPIDTCLSIYFQNFFNVSPYANDLEDLAHYYAQYLRLTDHWRTVLPPATLLEVPYEGLVEDQEGWTRRMLSFNDLPWDSRCLTFERTERSVITASRWQVRQRIHAGSVGRWRNYEQYIAPLRHLMSLERSARADGAQT